MAPHVLHADSEYARFQRRENGDRFQCRVRVGRRLLMPQLLSRLLQEQLPFPIKILPAESRALPLEHWYSFACFDAHGSEILRGAIAYESEADGEVGVQKGPDPMREELGGDPQVEVSLRAVLHCYDGKTETYLLPVPLAVQMLPASPLCYSHGKEPWVTRHEGAPCAALVVQVTGRDKRLALSITRYTNQAVGKGGDLRREKTMTMGLHRDSAQVEALQGQPLVFSVDLGTLELSIKDFLSLRPGSVIHIPQVTSSQGLLRYGGRPVAEVDLEVEHDGLNMKVREWLALPPQAA